MLKVPRSEIHKPDWSAFPAITMLKCIIESAFGSIETEYNENRAQLYVTTVPDDVNLGNLDGERLHKGASQRDDHQRHRQHRGTQHVRRRRRR
jgi:hypothetical protein